MSVEAIPVSVPRLPQLRIVTHYATIAAAEFVIVRIRTDEGIEGLGEASLETPWTGEDYVVSKRCIDAYLAPAIVGSDPLEINRLLMVMDSVIPWHPYSKAAIEMALWDIAGKTYGQPLYNLLGGKIRDSVPIKFGTSAEKLPDTIKLVEAAITAGFSTVKLKTGFGVRADVDKVREVRRAIGESLRICVDSNAGWDVPDAISALRQMEEFDLLFAEQPVPPQNPKWMRDVRKRVRVPVAAHESIFTLADGVRAVDNGIADIWCLMPSAHGGLVATRKLLAIAEASGIPCLIGSTLELGIASAANLHLSVSSRMLGSERFPSDLSGPLRHEDDLIQQPLVIERGLAFPPHGVGLGVELDEAKLSKYRVA